MVSLHIIVLFVLLYMVPVLVPYLIKEKGDLKYGVATGAVRLLEKVPPISKDPISEIIHSLDILLAPIRKIFLGTPADTLGRVESPVRVTRPPISEAVMHWHYAAITSCKFLEERWDCKMCKLLGSHIQLVKVFRNPVQQSLCYLTVDHKKGRVVHACRGAINLGQLLSGAQVMLTSIPGIDDRIKVHYGIYHSVLHDYDNVVSLLRGITRAHPEYTVALVGWSYGAMQAAILMLLLKYRNLFPHTRFELFTYGSPRVGNRAYANFMNNLTIPVARVVNDDDLTLIFPAALGYTHYQNELFINDDASGNITARYCSTDYYEDPACAHSRPFLRFLFEIGMDHGVYFGIDGSECGFKDAFAYLVELLLPIYSYLPKAIVTALPRLSITTEIVQEIRTFFNAGIRNVYKIASNSTLYSRAW